MFFSDFFFFFLPTKKHYIKNHFKIIPSIHPIRIQYIESFSILKATLIVEET